MLVKPTVPELLRASAGSKPMTNEDDTSAVTLAADEIEEGKVTLLDEEEWENNNAENE